MIKDNLEIVKEKIAKACQKAKRDVDTVTLIAVSKTKPVAMLKECYDAGIRDFGENKVQEILDKYDQMPSDVRWHMIGHLQRNKVKYIIDKVVMIHSVDSLRLAEEISKQAMRVNRVMDILIEVNIASEESKFGVSEMMLPDFVKEVCKLPGVCVKGLMTVAPYVDNSEENRQHFVKMRQLCVDINAQNIDNENINMLSMGMSGDYTVAIEEGATHVRVGTSIFGERNYLI
ncbi:MAG: YggS family pyridoxal phosphate-dependent enzyme [Lachnospiraceae bacterium]|nr:YggS family pyridoxal phosphate-dependent enzyme [Lachnospiraceae bacterium]